MLPMGAFGRGSPEPESFPQFVMNVKKTTRAIARTGPLNISKISPLGFAHNFYLTKTEIAKALQSF
jgi:hypothetical protein